MQEEWGILVKYSFILKNKKLDDREIFLNAKKNGNVIIITKDADFQTLFAQYGCPKNY